MLVHAFGLWQPHSHSDGCQLLPFPLGCFSGCAFLGHASSGLQVNWQMLWADKKKRAAMRVLGWIVLAFAVLFPVGIFTGECGWRMQHLTACPIREVPSAMQPLKKTCLA